LYDPFGREMFKYLPYIQQSGNTNNGKFKTDPFTSQSAFYSNSNLNPGLLGEQVFYSRTAFEQSPLSRVDSSFAPGNSWGGSNKGVSAKNEINAVGDSVRIWTIAQSIGSIPTTSSKYPAGTLYKTVTVDEHDKQVVEYKDKEGKVILKKVQLSSTPSVHHTGWLCTYYVYDDFNQLRFVIPPKAVETIAGGWVVTTTVRDELCFRYEYDARKRMIIKKGPGAGIVNMVYDRRDRLVLVQDAIQIQSEDWILTRYDNLNRPIEVVNGNYPYEREDMQDIENTTPDYFSNHTLNDEKILTQTYYDTYLWVSGSGSGLSNSLITTYNSNSNYFYSASNTASPYPQAISATNGTLGMATGTKVNVVGTSNYLYNVSFYDEKGRSIQSHSTNYSGGKDTVIMQYDFRGKVLRTLMCHGKAGTNSQRHIVLTKLEYDNVGRVTALKKKTNNSPEVTISENSYDELGQLRKKNIGKKRDDTNQNTYTSNPMN